MPNTTKLALPYPQETDTADVPRDIQALAVKLDALAGTALGLALLDAATKVPLSELYAAVANGLATLDGGTKVPLVQLPTGPNGLATLGADGKVPAAQLPTQGVVVGASVAAINAQYPGSAPPNGAQAVLNYGGAVVPLTRVAGNWYSPEMPLGGSSPGIGTSGGGAIISTQGVGYGAAFSALSWQPANAGLTLQLKWSGGLGGSGNHILMHGGIYLWWSYNGGATSASMSDRVGWQDPAGVNTYVEADWANVSNPGGYDLLAVSVYTGTDAGGSGGISQAAVVGRWIG